MSELEISSEREMRLEEGRGRHRYNLRSSVRSLTDQNTSRKRCNGAAADERRTKKRKEEVLYGRWKDLPMNLLWMMITDYLSLPHFLSMRCVCKDWRLMSAVIRQSYFEYVPPLAMIISYCGKKSISFHNMVNGERYTTKVINYVGKVFSGITGGFITLENSRGIWFTHPITNESLEFLKPFRLSGRFTCSDRTIVAKLMPSNEYVAVVLHKESQTIRANRLGTRNWMVYSYSDEPWRIVDLAVCGDNIIGLTSRGDMGTVVLSSSSLGFKKRTLRKSPFSNMAKLVMSVDEQLMVVELRIPSGFHILRPDFTRKRWVYVEDLGNQALFFDDSGTYRFCDPRRWGWLTNCIYYLDSRGSKWSVLSLTFDEIEERLITSVKGAIETPASFVRGWYFPHQASSMPCLSERPSAACLR